MGYELQVFRGEDPDDERTFAPLDEDLARTLLLQAARAGGAGAEIVVPRPSLTASVALSRDREGTLRSLWVSVDGHDADATERERECREVPRLLAAAAEGLGAGLYDREERRFLVGEDEIDAVAAAFGRGSSPG